MLIALILDFFNSIFKKILFIYLAALGLCALHRLSLVAGSRGYSSLWYMGFSGEAQALGALASVAAELGLSS